MSKYYTPEIEEFHVGFEFEALFTDNKKEPNLRWVEMNEPFQFKRLYEWLGLPEPGLRVKYLDKEDIESLGLKLWQIPGDSFDWEFYLDSEKGESLGKVTFNDNNTIDELELFGTIFNIKNKSELKRILKQLSI